MTFEDSSNPRGRTLDSLDESALRTEQSKCQILILLGIALMLGISTALSLLEPSTSKSYDLTQEFQIVNASLVAPNLEGRMLAACVSAYGIIPNQTTFKPSLKYFQASGWLDTPVVLQNGPANIHAALVGRTVDGVVVAFRGTLGSTAGWHSYLDYIESDIPLYSINSPWGRVHAGAYHALNWLWSWQPQHPGRGKRFLRAEIQRQIRLSKQTSLYVTGHSKGGTMAILAAMKIHQLNTSWPTAVYTFANMKPGNAEFRRAIQATNISIWQYENYWDLVPLLLPPNRAQMRLLESELKINSNNATMSKDWKNPISNQNLLEIMQVMSFVSKNNPKQPYESWLSKLFHQHDDYEFHHVVAAANRTCMIYNTDTDKQVQKMKCTAKINNERIRRILQRLQNDETFDAKSFHKPSCRGMGYMHGTCEAVCRKYN